MSDKIRLTIEVDEAQARDFAARAQLGSACDVSLAVAAALPPEYPEGTVAWVTARSTGITNAAEWDGHAWVTARHPDGSPASWFAACHVTVEPMRALGVDEFAVPRPNRNDFSALHVRDVANRVDDYRPYTAQWLRRVADALEATEARS